MNEITRVGVDLAKRVIQVHAVDAHGRVVVAKALAADKFAAWCAQLPPGCLVAMEACGGAHHWARKLRGYGLDARLIAIAVICTMLLIPIPGFSSNIISSGPLLIAVSF